jgi:hypothetical protein
MESPPIINHIFVQIKRHGACLENTADDDESQRDPQNLDILASQSAKEETVGRHSRRTITGISGSLMD